MRVQLSFVVIATCFTLTVSEAGAAESSAVFKGAQVELSTDENPNYVRAQLRAGTVLKQIGFRFDDEAWQPTVADPDESTTYTMKHPRAAYAGRRVVVKAQDADTEKWIVISGEINAKREFEEQDRKIVDKAEAAKAPTLAAGKSGNANGLGGIRGKFLAMVNSYRARTGRGPVSYDHTLEAIAARNNQAGGYHNYTGGTPQIWAMGSSSVAGTLQQWQNSPPHNSILLGGYSRVGIAHDGRNWTANFR